MYTFLSDRTRAKLLFRVCQLHGQQLLGCWVRREGRLIWMEGPGQAPLTECVFYRWTDLGVRLACPEKLTRRVRRNLRRHYQRDLNRRIRQAVLRHWVCSLRDQRQQLGRALHKGLCQRLMVLELQAHFMVSSSTSDRAHCEQTLLQTLRETSREFAQFFQEQFGGPTAESTRAQLLRELAQYRRTPARGSALRKAFKWAGIRPANPPND